MPDADRACRGGRAAVTAPSAVAFVPARSGSERVPQKNVRELAGHPLLAYAIETALQCDGFERVVVSTDSEEIADVARWYGADVPFLRPPEYATSTSPDIEWLRFTLETLPERYQLFALIRATNPFRGPDAVRRGFDQLLATPEADSLRAVELVKQHPGKTWVLDEDRPHHAAASRPVAPRGHVARGAVPGAASRVHPEQRARDRLDACRHGDGDAGGQGRGSVLHARATRASTSTTRRTGSTRNALSRAAGRRSLRSGALRIPRASEQAVPTRAVDAQRARRRRGPRPGAPQEGRRVSCHWPFRVRRRSSAR